jgi:hypothetical protein
MSYLQAMIDKKVEKEQLPRGVQVKIENLEKAIEKISEYESQDDLDEEEEAQLEKLREGVKALDGDIERSILKFDPEKYKKKLEVMMEVRAKRKKKETPKVAKPEPQPEPQEEDDEEYEQVVEQNIQNVRQNAEVEPEELDLCEDCEEEYHSGRLSLEEIRESKRRRDEEEEFEKVSNAKPRKLSKSVIIMGIGAFILTWGAVNFFRERRG